MAGDNHSATAEAAGMGGAEPRPGPKSTARSALKSTRRSASRWQAQGLSGSGRAPEPRWHRTTTGVGMAIPARRLILMALTLALTALLAPVAQTGLATPARA